MEVLKVCDVDGINNLYKVGNLYFGGQPNPDCIEELKRRGVKRVFNLRNPSEMDFSKECSFCKDEGLEYFELPIICETGFNSDCVEKLNTLLKDSKEPEFIHCGSANRVAAWAMIYLVKVKGLSFDEASRISSEAGLTSFNFIDLAKDYLGL